MSNELISIVMPAYNSAETIGDSILSATRQSHKKLELIIVDDGSTDETSKICEHHARTDSRIKYFYQKNSGVSSARNLGIEMSDGDYVSFLDADDLWEKDKIEIQLSERSHHDDIVLTGLQRFSSDDRSTSLLSKTSPPVYTHRAEYARKILNLPNNEMAIFGTALVPKIHLKVAGVFDEKLASSEDWELWLRLAFKFPFVNVDQPLRLYRKHSGSLTKRTKLKETLMGQIYVINKFARAGELSPFEVKAAKTRKYIEFTGTFWSRGMRLSALLSAANAFVSCPTECGGLFKKIANRLRHSNPSVSMEK